MWIYFNPTNKSIKGVAMNKKYYISKLSHLTKYLHLPASITIESSFFYPLTFLIMAATILFAFYLHDKISIHSTTYRQALYCSFNQKDDNASANPSENDMASNISTSTLRSITLSVQYDDSQNSLDVNCLYEIAGVSVTNFSRCEAIRKYSVLLDFTKSQSN